MDQDKLLTIGMWLWIGVGLWSLIMAIGLIVQTVAG